MAVIAKFYVNSIELFEWGTTVKLRVVTKGEYNQEFWNSTPSGEISMHIKNDVAAEKFKPGQEIEVTFHV